MREWIEDLQRLRLLTMNDWPETIQGELDSAVNQLTATGRQTRDELASLSEQRTEAADAHRDPALDRRGQGGNCSPELAGCSPGIGVGPAYG